MAEPVRVLLVEDNPGDADLTRESLLSGGRPMELTVLVSGTEAIEFIQKRKKEKTPLPDLVLLDLNLPGVDGHGVLAEIKKHADMKRVPVSILTSSAADGDVIRSYELGANSYVVKPFDFRDHQNAVRGMENFWFGLVKLPPHQ